MISKSNPDDGLMVIGSEAVFEGTIERAKKIVVGGEMLGDIKTDVVEIQKGGRAFGSIEAKRADIGGLVEGSLAIRELCAIRSTGDVKGKINYGRLSMDEGAQIDAHLRNIPPELGGDLEMHVERGGAMKITLSDLNAFDPDDDAEDLTYHVSNAKAGYIARTDALFEPITTFTQADLEQGTIAFASDGSDVPRGGFDVIVKDAAGATSGKPQRMQIAIHQPQSHAASAPFAP